MDEEYGKATPHLSYREALTEVERLRAREAALVAVVEKVWTLSVQSAYDDKWFIPRVHATHELVEQARALLASETPQPLRAECHICHHLVTEAELVLAADGLPIGCQYCTNDAVRDASEA